MSMYKIKCRITSNVPVVPDDLLRYKVKKNGGADIEAFIEDKWMKIGYTQIWPDKTTNPRIFFKVPNPYEIKLLVSCN